MKVITALAFVGAVSAFAPQEVGRPATQRDALFDNVSECMNEKIAEVTMPWPYYAHKASFP